MRLSRCFIVCILFCLLGGPASAKFRPDPNYKEADKLLRASRFVAARDLGERMLKVKNPDMAFQAQCILGRVHLFGEGNPGKAYYYLNKAHKGMTRRYSSQVNTAEGPWRCYADALWALRLAAMDLERYEDALDWVTEYGESFPPVRHELYGWPLMKLGRMEDARDKMDQALEELKDKHGAINTVLNTMGAVEYEAANFEESLARFQEIIDRVAAGKGEPDAVFYSNAGEAARDLLDFPAAEKFLLQSTKHTGPYDYATPWLDLAELYIAQGRQPEALQALKRHSRHLANCEAGIQNQKRAQSQRVLGMTLMACGYDMEAAKLMESVALHGDRNSGTSTKRSLVRSRNHFFYREALKQKKERLAEERSYQPLTQWAKLYWEELAVGQAMESARRECAALAVKNHGPEEMIKPYGPRGFNCPWITPALGEIFGDGVIAVTCNSVLEDVPEASKPFVNAILAEANDDEELMQSTLEALPSSQLLLRGRLHALLGSQTNSAQSLQQALEADPPVFRRLGISLPVEIESSDSTIASMLSSSPRFHSGSGFILSVSGGLENGFFGHLQGPDGSVLTRFRAKPGADAQETRMNLCRELHQRVFAPRVNLTQADINGLDGSNLAGGHFREQLRELVGGKEADPIKP